MEAATASATPPARRPRVLCLHGFRTSGAIMREQILSKWPESLTSRLDLYFPDAPFPAEGRSDVEGLFPPPYFEWFQVDKATWEYRNVDRCLQYVEEYMAEHGPFDGLMGFSRGATLSAALVGMQRKGLALTKVPMIKFVLVIGGGRFMSRELQEKAYSARIECPSVHFIEGFSSLMAWMKQCIYMISFSVLENVHPRGGFF